MSVSGAPAPLSASAILAEIGGAIVGSVILGMALGYLATLAFSGADLGMGLLLVISTFGETVSGG